MPCSIGAASPFRLTLLTRDPVWAAAAGQAQVDLIGVDIERLGKQTRQSHVPDARISDHELHHLAPLHRAAPDARLFARLNPPHAGTRDEVAEALAFGATALMLPQFRNVAEVTSFIAEIGGRADAIILLERREALNALPEIVALPGLAELMVGLNDLSLALGLGHPMVMAASPLLDEIGAMTLGAGVRFGFGGVAGPDPDPSLPVQPDIVLARYAHLNASSAWVSRSFLKHLTPDTFAPAYERLRARIDWWRAQDRVTLDQACDTLRVQAASLGGGTATHR